MHRDIVESLRHDDVAYDVLDGVVMTSYLSSSLLVTLLVVGIALQIILLALTIACLVSVSTTLGAGCWRSSEMDEHSARSRVNIIMFDPFPCVVST